MALSAIFLVAPSCSVPVVLSLRCSSSISSFVFPGNLLCETRSFPRFFRVVLGFGFALMALSLIDGLVVASCGEFLIMVGFLDTRLHQACFDASAVLVLTVIEFHSGLLTG